MNFSSLIKVLFFSASLAPILHVGAVNAEIIFQDDFETGDFSTIRGAAKWGIREKATVVSDRAVSGSKSAKFHYPGNVDPTKDAWAELRFDLGALYPEVWIEFNLYIPSNFVHAAVSPNNNKFFRLWPATYDDRAKVGASFMVDSTAGNVSRMRAEWDSGADTKGMTTRGSFAYGLINSQDLGNWMKIRIYVKSATTSTMGTINIWKNGVLVVENAGTVNAYATVPPANAYRYGYLLGWANSGYAADTYLYLDDAIFATSEEDLNQTAVAPAAPQLNVE
jgi:hypothetical protein